MMTTGNVFGINRPGDHAAAKPQADKPVTVDAKKFEILSQALSKFIAGEFTEEQLKQVQDALK